MVQLVKRTLCYTYHKLAYGNHPGKPVTWEQKHHLLGMKPTRIERSQIEYLDLLKELRYTAFTIIKIKEVSNSLF